MVLAPPPTKTNAHYQRIASAYNDCWMLEPGLVDWYTQMIIDSLEAKPHHQIVDLAAGTGVYALEVSQRVQPDRPLLAVDPCAAMLAQMPTNTHVHRLVADADGMLAEPFQFDRMFIKDATHHLPDRQATFQSAYDRLPIEGKLLIIMPHETEPVPLFTLARKAIEQNLLPSMMLARELEVVGFEVSVTFERYIVSIPKSKYFEMIRKRFVSILHHFDDQAIEQGIEELDQKHVSDHIACCNPSAFITATKVSS